MIPKGAQRFSYRTMLNKHRARTMRTWMWAQPGLILRDARAALLRMRS
jgi:hypothetical protein